MSIYSPIENKSFALLRTNPRLTTNIKLVIDSNESMYFSAFKANKELSKVEFQKYPLKSSGSFANDIAQFYKNIPNSLRYQIFKKSSDLTIYSDFVNQYETQYQYGATHNTTKLYDEQYRLFAPIWLDKKTPNKFVVYRIEDVDYDEQYGETVEGQNNRIIELLNRATIIKTYDLSRNSEIGKYIYKHVNAKGFPNSAITFNFKEGEKSYYNGIDIEKGGFARKSESLDVSYTSVDYPEIYNNETITKGFSRNGIVSANIMNLEFLFDDNTAEDYKIYRYFGLYVDEVEEGTFDISHIDARGIVSIHKESYKTGYDLDGTSLSDLDMFIENSELKLPTLNYLKDKNGMLYHVQNGSKGMPIYKIPVSMNNSNIEDFRGFSRVNNRITAVSKDIKTKGFLKLNIVDTPDDNDRIFIGDKGEIAIEGNNVSSFTFLADSSLPIGTFDGNKFSSQGSFQQIAISLSRAINSESLVDYNASVSGDSIIIEDFLDGNRRRQTAFGVFDANSSNFLEIEGELNSIGLDTSITNDWTLWTPISGSSKNQLIYVESSEVGNLQVGQYVKTKDLEVFSEIIEISKDPFENDLWRIILNKPTILSDDNVFDVYEVYRASHGKLSAYNFKDFDFDFYSTRNTTPGDLILSDAGENPLEYFSWLNPVLEADTAEDVVIADIYNEYDRLNENQLKETSLTSRVVPTICKFKLKDSSNARNFEYILNANEAFGADNMSPNIEVPSSRNIEYLNMEHFHFNKIPSYIIGTPDTDINLTNYVDYANDGGLTFDRLTSTTNNYFLDGLVWNGWNHDTGWIDNELKINYSKFREGSLQADSSTVFRGLRYLFKKRKESINAIPSDFIKTSEVNGYKFATVVDYVSDSTVDNNEVIYQVIKNDAFKFICVLITVNIVKNQVDFLDRYNVYELEDIREELFPNDIINVTIPFQIDLGGSNWNGVDEPATITASQFSITDGSADFEKYITLNKEGSHSWITFPFGPSTWAMKVTQVLDKNTIRVSGHPYEWNPGNPSHLSSRFQPANFSLVSISTPFEYFEAGSNEFANLLEELNANNMADRFNKFGDIEYITVDLDGNLTYRDFALEIESGTQFIKPSLIKSTIDPEKPKAYQLTSGSIGSIVVDREDGGYITLLRRMNGDYNPLFTDVVTFTDIYNTYKLDGFTLSERERLIYEKFNYLGIAFESYKMRSDDYGYIKNYFYHKVNDENSKNILKLSQTTDKLPLYPAISEIAIDKKDINLFKSKYSVDFFNRALPAGKFELVHGTLSPIEKENFFASTVMKVKDSYDITKFTQTSEETIEILDDVRINELNKTSIHWTEDDSYIEADFYLPKAISSELKEDFIKTQFARYVDPENSYGDKTSIEDDLDVYINNNITTRFIIDSIKIYGLEKKSIDTEFTSVTEVSELTSDGYKELTNYTIQDYQGDALSFRLIYNKRPGYSYKLRVHIKIQA